MGKKECSTPVFFFLLKSIEPTGNITLIRKHKLIRSTAKEMTQKSFLSVSGVALNASSTNILLLSDTQNIFIQQISTKHLFYTKHCTGYWVSVLNNLATFWQGKQADKNTQPNISVCANEIMLRKLN